MTALDRRDPSPPITRLPRSDPLDTTPSLSCRSVWAVWPHGAIERNNGCDTVEPHITSERRGVIISAADSRAGGSRSILALCGRDERVGSSKRKTRPLTRQPRCDHLETAPSLSCPRFGRLVDFGRGGAISRCLSDFSSSRSSSRLDSNRIVSVTPTNARWYRIEVPTAPPPMTTTLPAAKAWIGVFGLHQFQRLSFTKIMTNACSHSHEQGLTNAMFRARAL